MSETSSSSDTLARAVRQQLESLQASGLGQLPKAKRKLPAAVGATAKQDVSAKNAKAVAAAQQVAPSIAAPKLTRSTTASVGGDSLEILRSEVAACRQCDELARTRTQTVFGVGNPAARLCFVGEAPGADEDRRGEPFVGRAGQLLDKIIEACRMRREDVYILNILKCRPPGNRVPLPEESQNCRGYFERQLALIQPEYICCLGSTAAQNLLGTTETIGKLRGRLHQWGDIRVLCTYHPAYLLRNPAAKKDVWEDMQYLMRELGMPTG